MRLAACALSAVLLSGCSWLGLGGQGGGYGTAGGAYGANCLPGQAGGYGQTAGYDAAYGYGAGAGCVGGGYGVGNGAGGYGGVGYGAGGYGAGAYGTGGAYGNGGAYGTGGAYGAGGAGGYGAGANGAFGGISGYGPAGAGFGAGVNGVGINGAGFGGANGAGFGGGFGPGAVGAGLAAQGIGGAFGSGANGFGTVGGVTTLGAGAPFGSAAFGSNVVGTQFAGGQFVNGAAVQNVVGAPIYVPQPYAAPFGVPQLRGIGAALPFGFEVFGGTEFDVSGELFGGKEVSPSDGGGGQAGEIEAIDYSDAFSDGYTIGGATTYDISRNTTLLGSLGYSKRQGQTVSTGSFQPGTYDAAGNFVPGVGSSERALSGEFSDLEQVTLEGGVRQYMGNNIGFRPYIGATAGFAYNNDVDLTQTYVDDGTLFDEQQFIESGWRPTASGVIGAEMAVGPRAAIGVESGLRWRDNLKANSGGEDRLSIPLKLRGRVAF